MCVDSSYQMINILGCLQSQGLLGKLIEINLAGKHETDSAVRNFSPI